MQSILVSWLVVGAALLLAGCGSREGPDREGGPNLAQTSFASRLDAAKAIGDPATRDGAFSQLAVDAAAVSDVEIAKKALAAIGDPAKKDEAASKVALKLAKAGMGDEANAVARRIGNPVLRDEALGKIAKGDLGDLP